MADSKKYNGSTWEHSLRKLGTATDTLTTLPADIYADGTNATVGISGNMSQTGTPTPDNPIQPQETGERTGNLAYGRINDVNISSVGRIETESAYDIAIARVEAGIVYTANTYVFAFYTNEPTILSVSYNRSRNVETAGEPSTFTAPITGYVAFRLNSGEQAMLNTGSTLLPYEPYGIKIPISSASTTTPVYLGEVQTTRKIKKLVLMGEEDWRNYDQVPNTYRLSISNTQSIGNPAICSHFVNSPIEKIISGKFTVGSTWIYFRYADVADLADFKAYLAQQYANGTPVTVWYVLSSATTGIVNEPLMKIGDYADTVSGITIPTIIGKDTFDVETTLKPSEASLSYTGWHNAEVEEWDGSQWT